MKNNQFTIDTALSSIEWTGRKVTGAHNGTIQIADGTLTLTDGGKLSGGQFTIDTRSIKILDVTDPNTNAQFAGHLASEDFFSSEKYPGASLEITGVSQGAYHFYAVDGNLTIKGITHPVHFEATIDAIDGKTLRASARLVIDRTLYDMKFRSGNFFKDLGDTLIYNEFTLDVHLFAHL